MKCAIYCRVSTEEQALGGHSIEAQRQELTKYCYAFEYEIHDFYIDAGFSAATMERPALQKMLEDSKNYDIALVWRLDRISRDMADLMKILEVFQNNNVAFKSKMENFDTSTASGKLMLNMLGSFAEFERASISDRIKMAHRKILGEGKWRGGEAPYGYRITDEKVLGINEDEAKAIRLIFDWSANRNIGTRTISIELNKLGYKRRTDKPFTSDYITKILKNPVYYGQMIHGRQGRVKRDGKKRNVYYENYDTYQGAFEPIITEELFRRSEENMAGRKLNRGTSGSLPNPVSGLVYCGDCKNYMLRSTRKDGERFFTCKQYKNIGECTSHYISEDRILKEIRNAAKNLLVNQNEVAEMNKRLTEQKEKQISAIQKGIDRLEKQLEGYNLREDKLFGLLERGVITEEEFIRQKNRLTKEQTQMKQDLKDLRFKLDNVQAQRGNRDFLVYIRNFYEAFERLTPEEKKVVLRKIIERIEIMDNKKPYERKAVHIYFRI